MVKLYVKMMSLCAACILSIQISSGQVTGVDNDDIQMMREWIKVLGSDEFGGRKPMTEYEDLTVNYLVEQMKGLGLEPAFGGS